ncbi:fibronectin type 3 and ankyrin repeat domains protein 1-like [Schistocerca americana]|uniref:fibronectin type 3 and ankyrin repeat domains protein 1-like n=1 Tax=Schistocerca americana TaxID=7009 RepID=UPI001F4F3736|nr:fibronectin type 3 and ankyrin repeat domains protein 1-like [Schistocerca americana]
MTLAWSTKSETENLLMELEKNTNRKREVPQRNATGELILAVKRGRVKYVQDLLAAGAKITVRDRKGNTALHWAAQGGNEEAARYLLRAGANMEAVDSWWRQTPLHRAAEWGHEAVAKMLLIAGADPDICDGDGRTSLHLAALGGHVGMVTVLLAASADRGIKDYGGRMPVDMVREKDREQLLPLLRCCGIGLNVPTSELLEKKIQW